MLYIGVGRKGCCIEELGEGDAVYRRWENGMLYRGARRMGCCIEELGEGDAV